MELLFGGEHCLAFATDGSHTQDTCRAGGDLQPILIVLYRGGVCVCDLYTGSTRAGGPGTGILLTQELTAAGKVIFTTYSIAGALRMIQSGWLPFD